MRELVLHADVARRIDPGIRGPELIVHLHTLRVMRDAGRLQAEPVHVGHAARAHQDLVHGDPHQLLHVARVGAGIDAEHSGV